MIIYTSLPTIMAALHRIINSSHSIEHVTSTACSGLIQNYYPINKYITTPEARFLTMESRYKKPDYTVETLDGNGDFQYVFFLEAKSLINSNFNNIVDQLLETLERTLDGGIPECGTIVASMKGTKIAIYYVTTLINELDAAGVPHYKGVCTYKLYFITRAMNYT